MRKPEYTVRLKPKEVKELKKIITSGTAKARAITRARILLFAHQKKSNLFMKEALHVTGTTIIAIKKRYREKGLEYALSEKPRPGKPSLLTGRTRALITALACSKAPQGRTRWTLRLLADKVVELGYVEHMSHVAMGKLLKKTNCALISKNNGVLKH